MPRERFCQARPEPPTTTRAQRMPLKDDHHAGLTGSPHGAKNGRSEELGRQPQTSAPHPATRKSPSPERNDEIRCPSQRKMLIWNHQGSRSLVIPCSNRSGAFIEGQENERSTDVEPLGIFQTPPGITPGGAFLTSPAQRKMTRPDAPPPNQC